MVCLDGVPWCYALIFLVLSSLCLPSFVSSIPSFSLCPLDFSASFFFLSLHLFDFMEPLPHSVLFSFLMSGPKNLYHSDFVFSPIPERQQLDPFHVYIEETSTQYPAPTHTPSSPSLWTCNSSPNTRTQSLLSTNPKYDCLSHLLIRRSHHPSAPKLLHDSNHPNTVLEGHA